MLLWLQTWPEIEAYLARSQAIILPIGSTEQHGPNGLIGTDAICAEHVARAVGEAAGTLVAPTISVGMAVHHMAFAGTMTHTPAVLIAILHEQVEALAAHGFRRFFFINGHGGNIATVGAAFAEIHARRWQAGAPGIRCALANWWEVPEVAALSRRFYGDADGSHATASEVAITRHLYPDHIKQLPLSPPVAPDGRFHDAADFRSRFPDGRMGSNPGLATADQGRQLFDAAVQGMAEQFQGFATAE